METDSWTEAGAFQTFYQNPLDPLPALDGCTKLPFKPQIKVSPDVQEASKPSGLKVDVHVPQQVDLDSEGLSASDVKNITVDAARGRPILNPSAAWLGACSSEPSVLARVCSEPAIRWRRRTESTRNEPGVRHPAFTHISPAASMRCAGYPNAAARREFCPNASKIAEVTIHSPLLPNPLDRLRVPRGAGSQTRFGSVEKHVAQYLVAEDPEAGVARQAPGRSAAVQGRRENRASRRYLQARGRSARRSRTIPSSRSKTPNCTSSVGNARRWRHPSHCGAYTTNASYRAVVG